MAKRARPAWLRTPLPWLVGAVLLVIVPLSVEALSLGAGNPQILSHDTYYVVAERRQVLGLPAIFALFAAFYLWCELRWGYRFDPRLGRAHFGLMALGAALAVLPGFILSLWGMPGQYADSVLAFSIWNRVGAIGYSLMLLGLAAFLLVCLRGPWPRRSPGVTA